MTEQMTFMERLKLAWRILTDVEFCGAVRQALAKADSKPESPPPAKIDASGLMLLAAFQREGRLVDFLNQEASGFSDDEIGAAARIVHGGCRKVLQQFFEISPAVKGEEGATMSVPPGFDSQRIRLTGNITGRPPFRGTLKHHGWIATTIRMPQVSDSLDPSVVAPAEVELP